mgnify:CR=1 FL=1
MRKVITYAIILALAFGNAMSYHIFVFPNRFAPSGLNGLCTIIQELTGLNVGYMSLIINIPLALMVFEFVNRKLAFRSMIYVITFSVMLVVLEKVDLSAFAYSTENGTSTILGPLVAGIIYGSTYSMLVQASAYSGGTDFIAAIIDYVNDQWAERQEEIVAEAGDTLREQIIAICVGYVRFLMEAPTYRSILMLKDEEFDNLYHKKRTQFGSLTQTLNAQLYKASGFTQEVWERKLMMVRSLIFGVLMLFFFRCKKPLYYAIVLVAAVAIWAAFRFGLGVLF